MCKSEWIWKKTLVWVSTPTSCGDFLENCTWCINSQRDSLDIKSSTSWPVPICCLPLSSSVSCPPSHHELTAHNQAEQALTKVLILLEGHAYPRAAVKRAKESSLSQVYVVGHSMWTNKRQIDLSGGGGEGTWLFSDDYPPPEWSKGWEAFFPYSSKDELLFAFMIPSGYNWGKKNRTDNEELGKIRQVLYILQKLSLQVPKIQSFEICRYKEGEWYSRIC